MTLTNYLSYPRFSCIHKFASFSPPRIPMLITSDLSGLDISSSIIVKSISIHSSFHLFLALLSSRIIPDVHASIPFSFHISFRSIPSSLRAGVNALNSSKKCSPLRFAPNHGEGHVLFSYLRCLPRQQPVVNENPSDLTDMKMPIHYPSAVLPNYTLPTMFPI